MERTNYLIDTNVAIYYFEIRKKYNLKLPDAIIAASAIVYNLILISRNVNDFINIAGLEVVNPWDN